MISYFPGATDFEDLPIEWTSQRHFALGMQPNDKRPQILADIKQPLRERTNENIRQADVDKTISLIRPFLDTLYNKDLKFPNLRRLKYIFSFAPAAK